jgi:alkanesulfonate monooxygenase SsuD/methylene tetrahydromethanopterin reductase-like flavin-dependent oxidoreductase (luciferase family)
VGWNALESAALGQDFRTRGARLDEQLVVLRRLWSEEVVDFAGRFHTLDRVGINPLPDRMIPLWIGGYGEPAMRRAIRFGDGFVFSPSAGDPVDQLTALKGLFAEAGRSTEGFGADMPTRALANPAEIVGQAARWERHGGTHLAVNSTGLGLDSLEAHIDYLGRSAQALELSPRRGH